MLPRLCYWDVKGNITFPHRLPLHFLLQSCTHEKQGKTTDSFQNEGVAEDAFKHHGTELNGLCVRYLLSFPSRVSSTACGPPACMHMLSSFSTGETPDPNMPPSSLATAVITGTHLRLYFPPFVSNRMHLGNDWSDMNLIRSWCHIRNPIKRSSSPNKLTTERKHLMAWRAPVYVVPPAGILNELSSQKLGFILASTNKNPCYLNTLLALHDTFLHLFFFLPLATNQLCIMEFQAGKP